MTHPNDIINVRVIARQMFRKMVVDLKKIGAKFDPDTKTWEVRRGDVQWAIDIGRVEEVRTERREEGQAVTEHCHRLVGWNRPGYLPEADPEIVESWDDAVAYIIGELHRSFPDGGVEGLIEEITNHEPAIGAVFGPDPHGYIYFIDRAP